MAVAGVGSIMFITKTTRMKLFFSFLMVLMVCSMLFLAEKYNPGDMEYKLSKLQQIKDTRGDVAIEDRIGEAQQCYALFLGNPILGVGAGYSYNMFRNFYKGERDVYVKTNFTHSDIMFMLSKLGVIGLFLFLWFYYNITKLSWMVWKRAPTAETRGKGLVCFLVLITAQIMGQSTPVIQTRSDAFLLSLVMGYTYCLYRLYVARATEVRALEPFSRYRMGRMLPYGEYSR